MAHLRSTGPSKTIHPITLGNVQDEFLVGRNSECSLVIEDNSISRLHARLTWAGDEYYVQDLHSRNKTKLNGVLVDPDGPPQLLRDRDKLAFSHMEFVFHSGDPAAAEGGILFVDDDDASSDSTIMSKVGVSSAPGALQLTASPEAKLNALLEINRNLGRALALDEVLPQVLNSLFKIFVQADRGFIALRNPDGTLVPRWSRAWREDAAETIRVSRTIVNKVLKTQEAILSKDAMMDEEFNKSLSVADYRIRSVMCAPLLDSLGNSIGVLQIDTVTRGKQFQAEDLEVLVAVAAQAGIAIDNAQLHESALSQRVMERDLALAYEVQQGFLPHSRPDVPRYEFYDFYRPARQIGGDYFDYLPLPDGRIAVIVADVVGKGVAAALLMAKLSAEARFCLAAGGSAADAITLLNVRLCRMRLDRFVTAVLLLLDAASHEVSIANAGHMAPLLRTRHGRVAEVGADVGGLPLGVNEDLRYQAASARLAVGESLTMYTDGLNEAVNAADELYSIERIRRQVAATDGPPTVIGEKLVQDVCDFVGQGAQSDDMCLVVLGRVG